MTNELNKFDLHIFFLDFYTDLINLEKSKLSKCKLYFINLIFLLIVFFN